MRPIVNSYFSGCGLIDIGLQQSGVELGQSFEIDAACCATARANFNHNIVQCDIQQKLALDEAHCDVMVFTYPCNRYSAIADIHGKRIGDVLYLHAFRHIAIKQPASRKRTQLKHILEKDPEVHIPSYLRKRLKGHYRDLPIISDPAADDIAPTCVAHYSKDLSTRLVVDRRSKLGVRPYTVREYARLQGVPDSFEFQCCDSLAYKMIGNGVSIPVGRWIGRESRRYFKMN